MKLYLLNETRTTRDDVDFIDKTKDVVVDIDLAKVDAAWSKTDQYIGRNGAGQQDSKYERFKEFLATTDDEIIMPQVTLSKGLPFFNNGRHRTAVFRDMGFRDIPVVVPKRVAKEFARLYGI